MVHVYAVDCPEIPSHECGPQTDHTFWGWTVTLECVDVSMAPRSPRTSFYQLVQIRLLSRITTTTQKETGCWPS